MVTYDQEEQNRLSPGDVASTYIADGGQPMKPIYKQQPLYRNQQDRRQWQQKLARTRKDVPDGSNSADAPVPGNRRAQLQSLVGRYNSAMQKQKQNRLYTATRAKTLSITNPTAAKFYAQGRARTDAMPTSQFFQNQKLSSQRLGNIKGTQSVDLTDQQMDKNSQVSKLYREQLRINGIQVPQGVSAADIKRVFPLIQLYTKRDTQVYGIQTGRQNKLDQLQARRQIDAANRALKSIIARQRNITDIQKARILSNMGFAKQIISKTLSMQNRSGGGYGAGGGAAAHRIQSALTLQYPATVFNQDENQDKFLIRRQGLPADKTVSDKVNKLNFQASKYSGSLRRLQSMISMARSGMLDQTFFDSQWPTIQSMFADATQNNIKFRGNGVANGPDIQQAVKQIGDPSSFIQWARSGNSQKVQNAISSITQQLKRIYKDSGYVMSDKPHSSQMIPGGGGGGGGGDGVSTSKSEFDPTDIANEALEKSGYRKRVKKSGSPGDIIQPKPGQKPIDPGIIETNPNEVVQFKNKDGTIIPLKRKNAQNLQARKFGVIVK